MSDSSGLVLQVQSKATIVGNVNLLIIEDRATDIFAIAKTLKSADIDFIYDTVSIEDLTINAPDPIYSAIVYDYHLDSNYSEKSPQQQLAWWYELTPKIPLILITDALGDEIAVELIQSGIDGYILRENLSKLPIELENILVEYARKKTARNSLNSDLIERQRRKIRELETAKRDWEALEEEKKEQISHLNHELRSPISSVLGFAKMLKEEHYGKLNGKQKQYVKAIVTTGKHLLDLTNNYLDLAKIEANKQELTLEKLTVEDVCQAALFMAEKRANDKGLKLVLDLADDIDFCIADSMRLKQMLVNLITNAVKFTMQGSVTLRVDLNDKFINFSVIDTGIGISQANIHKLFQPFQQIKGHHEGTGLGLVLSRKLAQLHGGDIKVTSEAGKGSCFKILLPRRS